MINSDYHFLNLDKDFEILNNTFTYTIKPNNDIIIIKTNPINLEDTSFKCNILYNFIKNTRTIPKIIELKFNFNNSTNLDIFNKRLENILNDINILSDIIYKDQKIASFTFFSYDIILALLSDNIKKEKFLPYNEIIVNNIIKNLKRISLYILLARLYLDYNHIELFIKLIHIDMLKYKFTKDGDINITIFEKLKNLLNDPDINNKIKFFNDNKSTRVSYIINQIIYQTFNVYLLPDEKYQYIDFINAQKNKINDLSKTVIPNNKVLSKFIEIINNKNINTLSNTIHDNIINNLLYIYLPNVKLQTDGTKYIYHQNEIKIMNNMIDFIKSKLSNFKYLNHFNIFNIDTSNDIFKVTNYNINLINYTELCDLYINLKLNYDYAIQIYYILLPSNLNFFDDIEFNLEISDQFNTNNHQKIIETIDKLSNMYYNIKKKNIKFIKKLKDKIMFKFSNIQLDEILYVQNMYNHEKNIKIDKLIEKINLSNKKEKFINSNDFNDFNNVLNF